MPGLHSLLVSLSASRRVTELTDAEVHFGLIPKEDWFQPDWIDEQKATAAREDMQRHQVIYGGELHASLSDQN